MSFGVPTRKAYLDILEMFDPEVQPKIKEMWEKEETDALVVFRNQDFSSSEYGDMSCLQVGPKCTYKAIGEVEGKPLGETPSVQKYPMHYCLKAGIGYYLGRKYGAVYRTALLNVIARNLALWDATRRLEQLMGDMSMDELMALIDSICVGLDVAEDFDDPKVIDETFMELEKLADHDNKETSGASG